MFSKTDQWAMWPSLGICQFESGFSCSQCSQWSGSLAILDSREDKLIWRWWTKEVKWERGPSTHIRTLLLTPPSTRFDGFMTWKIMLLDPTVYQVYQVWWFLLSGKIMLTGPHHLPGLMVLWLVKWCYLTPPSSRFLFSGKIRLTGPHRLPGLMVLWLVKLCYWTPPSTRSLLSGKKC